MPKLNSARTIGASFNSGANNFNALRLFAALLVLWSHSYPLTGLATEPLAWATRELETGGGLGVMVFFVISGFLVTKSAIERSAANYIRSRIARILPLLAAVTLAEVVLLGLLISNLPLREYATHDLTRAHLWNIAILRGMTFALPGVFEALPNKAVNGSLWTLPIEVGFYVFLPLGVAAAAFGRRTGVILWVAIGSAYLLARYAFGLGWAKQGTFVWSGAQLYPVLKFATAFLCGSVLWLWRDRIPLNGGLALAAALALVMAIGTPGAHAIYVLVMPYLVLYAALAKPIAQISMQRLGDLSYGTYLLAFPVQQTLVWKLGPAIGATRLSLLATPIVLSLAFICWRLIEAPCLAWRKSAIPQPHNNASSPPIILAHAS